MVEKILTRNEAIKIIVKDYWPFCSCGNKLVPWYEGGVECEVSDKEFETNHNFTIFSDAQLEVANFLMEFFGISDEQLKEARKDGDKKL